MLRLIASKSNPVHQYASYSLSIDGSKAGSRGSDSGSPLKILTPTELSTIYGDI